jgi:alpha-L-rhamnosidase
MFQEILKAAKRPRRPVNLRCEYLENPLGVDVRAPRFFWICEHPGRGQKQTACRVVVSTAHGAASADMWDSGHVESPDTPYVVYGGRPLESDRTYFWKVKWWDRDGRESPWSRTASFGTGLFEPSDWTGEWIGGGGLLRREFALPAEPIRARAYICGLGYHELRINGRKVGAAVLDPGWTTYEKRVLYAVHDVTPFLKKGANAVGVMLGAGWFKGRALRFRLTVVCAGGRTVDIASDGSWTAAAGPIVEDSLFDGETYDARREETGWDAPGFKAESWTPAERIEGPAGEPSSQMMPPIRVVDTLAPRAMSNPRPGVFVFDMGRNFSGWAAIRVSGPAGAEIRIRFAELLYPDGTLNRENLRNARAEDRYILKGEGVETWEPRFTYHGFRYVEVSGWPGVPQMDSVRGRVVHSGVEPAGNFAASKPVLNRIQDILLWGLKSNLHSVPTDCCQRDERMGWMGDAQATAETAILNFDMAAFYTNFIRNIRDVQGEDGSITDTVPHVWGKRPADPAWGAAYPLLCRAMFRYYGDRRVLEENYDGLKAYVEFLRSQAEDGLVRYSWYGDWVALEKCPGDLVSSFYYLSGVRILAAAAGALGREDDARVYGELAEEIREAFHRDYFDPKTRSYGPTQTANVLALYLDIPPEDVRLKVWDSLFDNIVYGHDSHLTTGIIGTKYILEYLARRGNADLAYDIAVQETYPSWGHMIAEGATTVWELWQKREGPSMNSHNHPMLGSIGAWLFKALGGIEPDDGAPGFGRILFRPRMVRDLGHAAAATRTVRGGAACSWSRGDGRTRVEIVVPVGGEGEVRIPTFNDRRIEILESGRPVWSDGAFAPGVDGVAGGRRDGKEIVLLIGSGRYVFEMTGE